MILEKWCDTKWFKEIDEIDDTRDTCGLNLSSKFVRLLNVNRQIEVCDHTMQEVKDAIDDILSFWNEYIWYKNNWLCRNIINYGSSPVKS